MARRIAVLGGGISGLAAAYHLKKISPPTEVFVLEASARPGGMIQTERTAEGLLVEYGPDCLHGRPTVLEDALFEWNLASEVITPERPIEACVALDGALTPLPVGSMLTSMQGVRSIFSSRLLSWQGKLRLLAEPFCPPRRSDVDESVAMFLRRRCGREFLERIVDPVFSSIYATPTDTLSAQCTLAPLKEYEAQYASITMGLLRTSAQERQAPALPNATGDPSCPKPVPSIVSFKEGMVTLPNAIADALGSMVHYDTRVERVELRHDREYTVRTSRGALRVDGVLIALPVTEAARVCETLEPSLSELLAQFEVNRLLSVAIAYNASDISDSLIGTGFVMSSQPSGQSKGIRIQAGTWSSRKFAQRAPGNRFLARCTVASADASVEDARRLVQEQLAQLLNVSAAPVWSGVRRIVPGLPSYTVGHVSRVRSVRAAAQSLPSFALTGNAYDGLGVPQCLRSAEQAAREVLHAR